MKHEEIAERLHEAHLEHLGWEFGVEECGNCAMYAEWAAPVVADAEIDVRRAVAGYCADAAAVAEEGAEVGNPYAVGLARGYRDVAEKLGPGL